LLLASSNLYCSERNQALNKLASEYLDFSEQFVHVDLETAKLYTLLAADCYLEANNIDYFLLCIFGTINLELLYLNYEEYELMFKWFENTLLPAFCHSNDILNVVHNTKSVYLNSVGQIKEALKYQHKAIDECPKIDDNYHSLGIYHSNLSTIYSNLGDLTRALEEINLSLNYLENSSNQTNKELQSSLATSYYNRGILCFKVNDFTCSDYNFKLAIEVIKKLKSNAKELFYFQNEIISLKTQTCNCVIARKMFDELGDLNFYGNSDEIKYLTNKLNIESCEGHINLDSDFNDLLSRVEQLDEFSKKDSQILELLVNRVKYLLRNNLMKTEFDYRIDKYFKYLMELESGINVHKKFDLAMYDLEYKLKYSEQILDEEIENLLEIQRVVFGEIQSEESRLNMNGKVSKIRNLFVLNYSITNDPYFFEILEMGKSGVLLNAIKEKNYSLINPKSENLFFKESGQRRLINYYKKEIKYLESNSNSITPEKDSIKLVNLYLEKSKEQVLLDKLKNEISIEFPEFADYIFHSQFSVTSEIQSTLAGNQFLLETVVTDSTCHLFFIGNSTIEHRAIDGADFSQLEAAVDNYTHNITNKKSTKEQINSISKILNNQDLSFLKSKNKLIIVPDGFLYKVPFELLEINGKPLYEDYAISYQYSYKLYLILKEQGLNREYKKDFVGVSFPVNEAIQVAERVCDDLEPSKLACTKQEVFNIENIIGVNQSKSDLTTQEFIDQAEGAKIIHIASHACPDEENHQLSRIHFKDDFLTNYDISAMNIDADIAVLSACETGTGKILDGEGAMTIAKAFFQAGVHTNIVSLWKVDDCSTAELMSYFYKHLKQGEDSDVALQNAKKDFLANSHPQYHDPYYWAGFIHMGDTDPVFYLPFRSNLIYFSLAGILMLFLAIPTVKALKKNRAA